MIEERVGEILRELPSTVELVAATKSRSVAEILEAIAGGVKIIGENYVQEAEEKLKQIGRCAQWHLLGHLQKNKVKKAVEIFDLMQSLDSLEIAAEIDKRASGLNRLVPVFIEVNSAAEKQKFGFLPDEVEEAVREISKFKNLKIMGLMTLGPDSKSAQDLRPYFQATYKIFQRIKEMSLSNVQMRYLSMGMSDSYRVAIEAGANMVRLGRAIFSDRYGR